MVEAKHLENMLLEANANGESKFTAKELILINMRMTEKVNDKLDQHLEHCAKRRQLTIQNTSRIDGIIKYGGAILAIFGSVVLFIANHVFGSG